MTPASPPLHIANPTQRFSHLHVDLVGSLPISASCHTHLLTVLDRSTRWAEAIPLLSTLAESCAAALIGGWIARFGVPEQITSDRGRQFCSSLWDALSHRLGVKMRFTTPYHPQSNSAVEPFHRHLKESLQHFGGRIGLWFPAVFTRPVSLHRRIATGFFHAPASIVRSLRGRQFRLLRAATARGPANRQIRLCPLTASVTEPVAGLPRTIPSQGTRHQVLRR